MQTMMIIFIYIEVGESQKLKGKGIMEKRWKVCVTGGASYVGSWLVKKLLEKGYTVHTTLRNSKEESKTGVLRGLPGGADDRLVLFEADIYRPDEYASAIQGCVSVFHLATPFQHQPHSQFKDMTEAAVGAVKSIIRHCIKSGTVRRLIYTGSVTSASSLKDDGTAAYKDFIDETCWTPLNHSFPHSHLHKGYTDSKTMAEKELLSYGKKGEDGGGAGMDELEVVSLVVGLVGGDTVLSYTPYSVSMLFSHLKDDDESESAYQSLKYLEDLIGKVPVAHIDDVCEAHIFCAENPSITTGSRFMVASAYALSADIANYYFQNYPEFNLDKKYLEGPERDIKWSSTKLIDKGFVYKYDNLNMILDDCIKCAKRMGDL